MPIPLWLVVEDLRFNYAKQCACLSPPPSPTFSSHYQWLHILQIQTFLLFPAEFLELSFPEVLWQDSCTSSQKLLRYTQPKQSIQYDGFDGVAEFLARMVLQQLYLSCLGSNLDIDDLGKLQIKIDSAQPAPLVFDCEVLVNRPSCDEIKIDFD